MMIGVFAYKGRILLKTRQLDRQFYYQLLTLAAPILLQNFIASSLNMFDTLMIGRLGENEVAAVGVANQVFFLFNLIANGAAAGCSIFLSQFWGGGDRRSIHKVVGFGLLMNLCIGLLFTAAALAFPGPIVRLFSDDEAVVALGIDYLTLVALSYAFTSVSFLLAGAMRSVGLAWPPMIISGGAVLVNIALNWVFIFGHFGAPAMGVRGAALATLIARMIETALMLVFCFRPSSPLRGRLRDTFSFTPAFAGQVLMKTLPILLNESFWAVGTMLYVRAYGYIGTHAIAASQISNTVQNLFMVACFSLASSSLVMIGNRIGGGRQDLAVVYSRRFSWLALLVGLILGATVAISAPAILTLFNVSPQAADAAIAMLRIFSMVAPIRVLNVVLIVGVFRGGGDAGFALAAEGVTMWTIGVPLAFLGAVTFQLPVEQVVLLVTAEEIVKCVISLIRLRSNRWLHDVAGQMKSQPEGE